jgi:hypothetical protein
MTNVVLTASMIDFPGADLVKLDRDQLAHWIAELRRGETAVRRLRKRLQALQGGVDRDCARPGCDRPVAGRPDALYCSTYCRVYAHRHPAERVTD